MVDSSASRSHSLGCFDRRIHHDGFRIDLHLPEEDGMGNDDKAENVLDKAKGKAKELEGKATGDEAREAQGKGEQSKADLKQAGEKVKDAFKH